MTINGPDLLPEQHKKLVQEMASEKHAHPILTKNLNATSDGIYRFSDNSRKVKIGRNDSCHCGSGKKYKKCCMK